jgi:predicted nuclease with TOPRIM domain
MQQKPTPEELLLEIEKMKTDLDGAKGYLNKLQQDRAKIKYTLDYNQDNYRYLQNHCGIVALDYVKNISDQMKRLRVFLKHAEDDISKFERNIQNLAKIIETKREELLWSQERESRKVIPFRRKTNE